MASKLQKVLSKVILTPCSLIYKGIVVVRNLMFNTGLLKQREFDVPVVVVGNLAVGGTGKTPHTEYIVSRMCMHYKIAVLSRGYKRKTSGFVHATPSLSSYDIGDEPYQIYRKYGSSIDVAVCEKRVVGIEKMLEINPEINLFVLDDAFQHRYVKPRVSILLTDYRKLPCEDKMLPLGTLREPAEGINRADIVVVTKCPMDMKPIDRNVVRKKLSLEKWQKLLFSTYRYKDLQPVFVDVDSSKTPNLSWLGEDDSVLMITGIANYLPMAKYLRQYKARVQMVHFTDHHDYSRDDLSFIKKKFEAMKGKNKYIITTEKDAVRLINNAYFPHTLREYMFYLPIEVVFLHDDEDDDLINLIATKITRKKSLEL
ncbi:MAG: tetraacyldisaccharide 4'-kinase [Bacteroidales bacterium]|nr:tetraacyldisaccharide 4'-kinase [Bacteroidales bacterium]